MAWAALIVILILLVVSAGFRAFAGVLALILMAVGFLYWLYHEYEERQSKFRISTTELVFEGVSLNSSYGSSYDVIGRIVNNSDKYTLNNVKLIITFEDCDKGTQKNCVIVSQRDEVIYINVPPKQARDFNESLYLDGNVHFKGDMIWSYSIASIKAT